MKNILKTSKWLRWTAAGGFGIMLVLNVMISLEFEKSNLIPSLTLVELGNLAFAQGEGGDDGGWLWEGALTSTPCTREICWIPNVMCDTFYGTKWECRDGWSLCYGHCEA